MDALLREHSVNASAETYGIRERGARDDVIRGRLREAACRNHPPARRTNGESSSGAKYIGIWATPT